MPLLAPEGLIFGMWATQVTSSRKGAKSRTHGGKVRSTGTKATTCVCRGRKLHALNNEQS